MGWREGVVHTEAGVSECSLKRRVVLSKWGPRIAFVGKYIRSRLFLACFTRSRWYGVGAASTTEAKKQRQ